MVLCLRLFFLKVFNVASSCVRVETDGVETVYNCGQTFMTQCGKKPALNTMETDLHIALIYIFCLVLLEQLISNLFVW